MKRLGLLAALLLVAGGLGGCLIILQPPANPIAVTATTSNASWVDSVTVPASGTVNYDVTLPSGVMSYPLITFELDSGGGPNLNLSLIDYTSYVTLASSSSPDYFAQGTLGLSSLSTTATRPGRQGISANQVCYSSCIIWPTNASHYYLSIENPTGGSVTVDLYAYGQDYNDTNEAFGKNTFANAIALNSGTPDSGAIETLGDNDFWYITSGSIGSLTFSAADNTTPVGLALALYTSSGTYIQTYQPSSTSTILVYPGDRLDVYSNNSTAGPSGTSGYNLSY